MDRFRRRAFLRPRRLLPLPFVAVGILALLLPTTFSASTASAAPAPGYAASFIPAGAGVSYVESIAVNPVTDTIYAGEVTASGYQLVVMDGSSLAIAATLELANEPLAIADNSVTNTVYVNTGAQIVVINGANDSITTTISLPGGSAQGAIAVDSSTNMIYAAADEGTSGNVVVIDGSDNTIDTTVSSGGGGPDSIAVDESTNVVWVANNDGSTVAAISGTSPYSIMASVSVTDALYLAVNPVTDTVYVVSSGAGSNPLTVIDGASATITTTVPISEAWSSHLAVDSAANVVFAVGDATVDGSTAGGTIVIDGATNTVADVIGPAGYVAAENTMTGAVYETSYSNEPAGMWVVTPSTANGISPLMSGPATASATVGVQFASGFTATGLPAPTITESGPLPAGITMATDGALTGTPAAGTAGTYPITVTASNGIAPDYSLPFTLTVDPAGPQPGAYTALSPVRVLDTRNGTGGYTAPVGPGGQIGLHVTGVDGVPSTGVSAVVLNVTATDATASSYVTVYPDGTTQPGSSNLNFTAGETIANLVVVPVGSDGQIDFYNQAGSVNLVADLEGYYATDTTGSAFIPAGPARMLDTRNGTGAPQAPVGPGGTIGLQITGTDGVPSTGVTAVVLNVTATDPTASSYVTVYPDGTTRPTASNLNFTAGETIPNLVTVPVGTDGKVDFYNNSGSTDLVADLDGYYTTELGSSFVAVSPVRMLDTRNGTGGYSSPVGPGGVISLMITGADGIAATGVTAVVLNVTATDPTASSYVTVYPDGTTRPTASNLNFTPGETVPNLVVVPVGADGRIDFYNNSGSVDLVADLAGYYTN
jgi:hypothetical protein